MGLSVFGGHEDMVNARLRFASGLRRRIVTASRIAPVPKRTMRVLGGRGLRRGIDFATRKLSLVQPSDDLRRNGLDVAKFDAGARDAIKAEIYGKHLQMHEQICESPSIN